MSSEIIDVGDVVTLTGTFTESPSSTTKHDPTTVSFSIKEPDGTTTTYVYGTDSEVLKSAVGVYVVDWPATQEGLHRYRWFSTGTGQAAEESFFDVVIQRVGS